MISWRMLLLLVWLMGAFIVLDVLYLLRKRALRQAGRAADYHWKGMVVLALILGALPAILLTAWHGHRVTVPTDTSVDRVLEQLLPAKK